MTDEYRCGLPDAYAAMVAGQIPWPTDRKREKPKGGKS